MGHDRLDEGNGGCRIPIVSIGMPVYNAERFVRKALDSLLAQTFTDLELVISDNGSSDRTPEICQEYAAKDQRIRYFRRPENIGMAANMNFVIRQARGEYFMLAASDDVWDRNFIASLLGAILTDNRIVGAFCAYAFINEDDQPIRRPRRIDYSGPTRFGRLLKMCWCYDDGFFYGLYNRKRIERVQVPTWWGVNAASPVNNAYPVCFYFLSVGENVLAGSSPLWFNRLRMETHHFLPFEGCGLRGYLAFALCKLNVLWESIRSIYRGSHSILLVVMIWPALFLRFMVECIRPVVSPMPFVGPAARKLKRLILRNSE